MNEKLNFPLLFCLLYLITLMTFCSFDVAATRFPRVRKYKEKNKYKEGLEVRIGIWLGMCRRKAKNEWIQFQ